MTGERNERMERRCLAATQDFVLLRLLELIEHLQCLETTLGMFRQVLSLHQQGNQIQGNQNLGDYYVIAVLMFVRPIEDYQREFLTTGQYTRVLQLQGRVSGAPPAADYAYPVVVQLVEKMIDVEEEIRKVRVDLAQHHGIEYDGLPESLRSPVLVPTSKSGRDFLVLLLNNPYFDSRREELMEYVNRVHQTQFYLTDDKRLNE